MAPKRTLTVNPGEVYNSFTVIREVETKIVPCSTNRNRYMRMVECRCKCDTIKVVELTNLVSGKVKSCGCYGTEVKRRPRPLYKRKRVQNNMTMINRVGKSKSKSGYYGIFPIKEHYYEATIIQDGVRIDIAYGKDPIQLNEIRLHYLQENNLKYKVV